MREGRVKRSEESEKEGKGREGGGRGVGRE